MSAASQFDLTGRLAVVTGARRGIGRGMSKALAQAGADIVGVSAQLEHSGSDVEADVTACGRSFTALRADLSRPEEIAALVREIDTLGPVDILVNNAGTIVRGPSERFSDADWAHVLQVNLSGQFTLTREIGRQMLERGRGKVIFTASMLSFQGGLNVAAYTASKSAIVGLTRALANEWAPRGVNVNAVAPGYIATDNTSALRADPSRFAAISDRIPAARWGTPEDLAGATVFLASDAASYVHGVVLPVDGGWLGR